MIISSFSWFVNAGGCAFCVAKALWEEASFSAQE